MEALEIGLAVKFWHHRTELTTVLLEEFNLILSVASEAGTACLWELGFPGVDQAFIDSVLTGRFCHPEFASQHAEDDGFFDLGAPGFSLFPMGSPVCSSLAVQDSGSGSQLWSATGQGVRC